MYIYIYIERERDISSYNIISLRHIADSYFNVGAQGFDRSQVSHFELGGTTCPTLLA